MKNIPPAPAQAQDLDKVDAELVVSLRARGRKAHVFDVAGIFGLAGKPVHQIAMQVIPNGEETESIRQAHKTLAEGAKRAGAGEEGARKDADIFANEKNIEALFRICRRVDDKGQATRWAAFPGVAWMRDNLSTDELGALLNLYDELKRKHAATPLELEDERVEAIAQLLAEHAGGDMPEAFLAAYPRWFLTHLSVLLAVKLAAARQSVEVLLEEREARQAERAALQAELAQARAELEAHRAGSPPPEEQPPAE